MIVVYFVHKSCLSSCFNTFLIYQKNYYFVNNFVGSRHSVYTAVIYTLHDDTKHTSTLYRVFY